MTEMNPMPDSFVPPPPAASVVPPALPTMATYSQPPVYGMSPIPVQSLGYSLPHQHARPGIITAIAVTSIVVACLSSMASLMSGCSAGGLYMASQAARNMKKMAVASPPVQATLPPPATLPADTSASGEITNPPDSVPATQIPNHPALATGPYGLGAKDRQVVMAELNQLQPMSPQRLTQLEAFLADNGTRVFPTGGTAMTPRRVQTSVSSSATHAGASDEDPGYCIFVTSWGTLKVYDDKASYEAADGSSAATDASSNSAGISASSNSMVVTPNTPTSTPLTAAEIQKIVQRTQQASGGKLTPAQLTGLTTALQDPNQTLIAPGTAWSPIRSATVNPDGSAFIMFSGGFTSIDPQGQINANAFGPAPVFNLSPVACGLSALDAVLSLLLAIYLFIAGVMILRQSPIARRLHRIYALIKIPLTIGGAIVLGWMVNDFYASIPSGAPVQGVMVTWMVFIGIIGLIYPITLLIVLSTKSVRDYYNAVSG